MRKIYNKARQSRRYTHKRSDDVSCVRRTAGALRSFTRTLLLSLYSDNGRLTQGTLFARETGFEEEGQRGRTGRQTNPRRLTLPETANHESRQGAWKACLHGRSFRGSGSHALASAELTRGGSSYSVR